jgi:uncharacterized YccA/Bax inhibitor family protein
MKGIEPKVSAATTASPPSHDAVAARLSTHVHAQGWISIAIWMTFGLLLEGLLAYKTPAYLLDNERRELFRLAHTHGTLLGLLLLVSALCGQRFNLSPPRLAITALRVGAALMPLGFLLAGIWHYESDPGLAIWLVPPSALLLIFAVVAFAIASLGRLRDND